MFEWVDLVGKVYVADSLLFTDAFIVRQVHPVTHKNDSDTLRSVWKWWEILTTKIRL